MTRKMHEELDNRPRCLASRRNFIIETSTGLAGCALMSLYKPTVVLADPTTYPFGWGSFFKGLFRLAKKVGMSFLGIEPTDYLSQLEFRIRREINESLARISGLGYGLNYDESQKVAAGRASMFMPMINTTRLNDGDRRRAAVVPFYDISSNPLERVASVLSTPTMTGLPFIVDGMEERGFGPDDNYRLIVPTRANQNAYNMDDVPDTYRTRAGAVEANYRGSEKAGDLMVKVYRKRPKSNTMQLVHDDEIGMEFGQSA